MFSSCVHLLQANFWCLGSHLFLFDCAYGVDLGRCILRFTQFFLITFVLLHQLPQFILVWLAASVAAGKGANTTRTQSYPYCVHSSNRTPDSWLGGVWTILLCKMAPRWLAHSFQTRQCPSSHQCSNWLRIWCPIWWITVETTSKTCRQPEHCTKMRSCLNVSVQPWQYSPS